MDALDRNGQQSYHSNADSYLSYMLRLWRSPDRTGWHASIEATITHERHLFFDLSDLFAFLSTQIGSGQPRVAPEGLRESQARNSPGSDSEIHP
jgi:hypothetical protein